MAQLLPGSQHQDRSEQEIRQAPRGQGKLFQVISPPFFLLCPLKWQICTSSGGVEAPLEPQGPLQTPPDCFFLQLYLKKSPKLALPAIRVFPNVTLSNCFYQ